MGRAFELRKGRKMKRWSAMAKTFTRIGKDIVMAIKEGGPNPDANSRLRAVWTGIGAVGTVLIGIFFFKEPATFWRLFFITTLIMSIVGLKVVAN